MKVGDIIKTSRGLTRLGDSKCDIKITGIAGNQVHGDLSYLGTFIAKVKCVDNKWSVL